MTVRSLKDINETDLEMLELLAGKEDWDQIQHMVRDERQVRMA